MSDWRAPRPDVADSGTAEPASAAWVADADASSADAAVAAGTSSADLGRPLRIALFTDNYGPGHSGILYAVQFLEGQIIDAGHECLVVAPACDGPNPHAGRPGRHEYRLPSMTLPGVPAKLATGRGFERALDEFTTNPPDVIHVHGLGPLGLLGVWAAQRTGVPLLVTWHTDFEAYADHYAQLTPFLHAFVRLIRMNTMGRERSSLRRFLRGLKPTLRPRGLSRRALLNEAAQMLNSAALVTTPSPKTAVRVKELAPAAHVRVSPNGADPLPHTPALPTPHGPRILYVGRIAPEKGIPLLLEAFSWVRDEIPNAELMIVGDWTKSPTLRQRLQAARRRGGVTLVGQIDRNHLEPYYTSADVFCFPSLTDTQALVLHEAAHAGLPIVSVDDELRLVIDVGVNGLIARPTPESVARALVRMLHSLEDPGFRATASARSRELAAQWTVDDQAAEMLRFYADLAAGRTVPESLEAVPPQGLNSRKRRLLATTKTDEKAMAAPAIIGVSSPDAASGRAATL